jgi:hypothetical protein
LGDRFDEVIDFMNLHKSKMIYFRGFNTFEYFSNPKSVLKVKWFNLGGKMIGVVL